MKHYQRYFVQVFAIFCTLPIRAEINSYEKDAPPAIVSEAKALVAKRDYEGIGAMVARIDTQYGTNHSLDYFRSLLGVLSALPKTADPAKIDFAGLWAQRRILWKILLTPYSPPEEESSVQDLRDDLSRFGVPIPFYSFERDRDQFIALRADAAALLMAYGNSLRGRIIPGYQPKPERGPSSVIIFDPKAAAAAVAEEKKRAPELERNAIANEEQAALTESLRLLGDAVDSFVTYDFTWPPDDDQTVNALITAFPPITESRDELLLKVASFRKGHLGELKKQAAWATPVPQNAPQR